MSSAEEIAQQFDEGDEVAIKSHGKRSKDEKAGHKHGHPEGDTRRIINNATNGEHKRHNSGSK